MNRKTLTWLALAIVAGGLAAAGSVAWAYQTPPLPKSPHQARVVEPLANGEAKKPTSILANGGVEVSDPSKKSLPAAWKVGANVSGVTLQWDNTVAHEGKASLHLKKTAQRYFPITQWSQTVKRTGSQTRLKVSAFVKAESMSKAVLDVQFVDAKGKWTHAWAAYIGAKEADDPPANHDWKPYEGVVAIPDGTVSLIVAPQIYGPGDVWFDDIAAEYTDAEPTDPTAL